MANDILTQTSHICPVCGEPTDDAIQSYRPIIDAEIVQCTCRTRYCPLFERTASERSLNSADELVRYIVRPRLHTSHEAA